MHKYSACRKVNNIKCRVQCPGLSNFPLVSPESSCYVRHFFNRKYAVNIADCLPFPVPASLEVMQPALVKAFSRTTPLVGTEPRCININCSIPPCS